MGVIKTSGVNLEGIEDVFRICGWQTGKAALRQRIAEYVEATDPTIVGFLKEMEKYDKPHLLGAPGSENNSERVAVKPAIKRGRPKKSGEVVTKAFTYKANSLSETNDRLQRFYASLVAMKLIATNTQQRDFIDLFTGKDTAKRVVWTGDVNTLAELFRELVTRKKFVSLPEGLSLWVMVNAHFWNKEGNREFGNDRLRCTRAPIDNRGIINWLVRVLDPRQDLDELLQEMSSQR